MPLAGFKNIALSLRLLPVRSFYYTALQNSPYEGSSALFAYDHFLFSVYQEDTAAQLTKDRLSGSSDKTSRKKAQERAVSSPFNTYSTPQNPLPGSSENQEVIMKICHDDSPRKGMPIPKWLNEWEQKWERTLQQPTRKPTLISTLIFTFTNVSQQSQNCEIWKASIISTGVAESCSRAWGWNFYSCVGGF